MIRKVIRIEYHRNGIMGAPFHIVQFQGNRDAAKNMIAIVFGTSGHVAVFDYELLKQENFAFGENSWRGNVYEKELREAIRKHGGAI